MKDMPSYYDHAGKVNMSPQNTDDLPLITSPGTTAFTRINNDLQETSCLCLPWY